MAHSKISICNMALAMLGADAIRSFDEKNKRARMSDVFFDITRDYLLSKFDWPFARGLHKLQVVVTPPIEVPEGQVVYALPSDCRTPRDILPEGSQDRWEVIQGYIVAWPRRGRYDRYTDEETPRILKYTKSEKDTSKYSDTFVNLMAMGLAVKMCPAVTQDKALTQALMEQFQIEQINAWESDANIGEEYRAYDETPENDTFVNPHGWWEDYSLRIR